AGGPGRGGGERGRGERGGGGERRGVGGRRVGTPAPHVGGQPEQQPAVGGGPAIQTGDLIDEVWWSPAAGTVDRVLDGLDPVPLRRQAGSAQEPAGPGTEREDDHVVVAAVAADGAVVAQRQRVDRARAYGHPYRVGQQGVGQPGRPEPVRGKVPGIAFAYRYGVRGNLGPVEGPVELCRGHELGRAGQHPVDLGQLGGETVRAPLEI